MYHSWLGGSVEYTLTSGVSFTADSSLDLTVDTDNSGVNGDTVTILVNCQAKCQELLTSLQAGEFDLSMNQGNNSIDVTGVTFSLASLDSIQVEFTVGAYRNWVKFLFFLNTIAKSFFFILFFFYLKAVQKMFLEVRGESDSLLFTTIDFERDVWIKGEREVNKIFFTGKASAYSNL